MKGRWGVRTENLTGRTFGKMTVLGFAMGKKEGRFLFVCKCSCGKIKEIFGKDLKNGRVKSCGCHKAQLAKERETKHGMSTTRLFTIWMGIKKRCLNSQTWAFSYYGGRGIKICARWKRDFLNFYRDMGISYEKHLLAHGERDTTIERINNNMGYSAKNCKWATRKEQANNKTNNRKRGFANEI